MRGVQTQAAISDLALVVWPINLPDMLCLDLTSQRVTIFELSACHVSPPVAPVHVVAWAAVV